MEHSNREHALLSASGAERWMSCTGSVELEMNEPEKTSVYAEEGTFAHELSELILRHKYGLIKKREFNKELKVKKENKFYTPEIIKCVDDYVAFVEESINEAIAESGKYQELDFETRLDLSKYVPESFGTGDVILVHGDVIHIIDLKAGAGKFVSAENNPQLRLYGLGALEVYDYLYDIKEVRMTIVQPRMDNISTDTILAADLVEWGVNEVTPKALEAWKKEGVFIPGKHCQFCKAKAKCRARAEQFTSIVSANRDLDTERFKKAKTLSDDEITDIMFYAKDAIKFFNDVLDEALNRAIQGTVFEGFKLVAKSTRAKFLDDNKVVDILLANGFEKEKVTKSTLLTVKQLRDTFGADSINELLGELIVMPQGAPELVPISDKRPALGSDSAKEDFNDIIF